jgi:hypothetical protein
MFINKMRNIIPPHNLNARGISTVVVWILGLALVLVIVVVVWGVVVGFIQGTVGDTDATGSCIEAGINVVGVSCSPVEKICSPTITCGPGETCSSPVGSGVCQDANGNTLYLPGLGSIDSISIKRGSSGSESWQKVKFVIGGSVTDTISIQGGIDALETKTVQITPSVPISEDIKVTVAPVTDKADGSENICPESRPFSVKLSDCV